MNIYDIILENIVCHHLPNVLFHFLRTLSSVPLNECMGSVFWQIFLSTVKVELGWVQLGLIRQIFNLTLPQRRLDPPIGSPTRYYCA